MFHETLWHAERVTYRAVTGGAYNFPGAYGVIMTGSSFPTKGAIPQPTIRDGTIYFTGKKVRGIGTLFISQVQVGDWIYAKDVLRQVDYIESDTFLTLTEAFPTDQATGITILICQNQTFKQLEAKNSHASASVTIQEALMAPGAFPFVNAGAPIAYDAGSGTIEFTAHK